VFKTVIHVAGAGLCHARPHRVQRLHGGGNGRPYGVLLVLAICGLVCQAWAQQVPDAGALLRQQAPEAPARPRPVPQPEPSAAARQSEPSASSEFSLAVKGFRLKGVSLLPLSQLQALVIPSVGQRLNLAQLQALAARVAEEYQRQGYLARVVLPPQDVTAGEVELLVVEGRLGGVDLLPRGVSRQKPEVVQSIAAAGMPPGSPVRTDALERAAQLLAELPGVTADAVLVPGRQPGELRLQVSYEDRPMLGGAVQLDNHGVRSTGLARLNAELNLDNPTGRGDQAALSSLISEGTLMVRAQYGTLLGPSGLRAQVHTSALEYRLLAPFKSSQAEGQARAWGLTARYPVLRSQPRNTYASVSWESRRLENRALGVESDLRRLDVGTLGLWGDRADSLGGGGLTQWSLALVSGRLDLSANAADLERDQAGPQRQGSFSKLTWTLARRQAVARRLEAVVQASGQWASKNLDSGEKLSLGGPGGVRAYPSLEASGDAGAVLNAELQLRPREGWRVGVFYDHGWVQLQRKPWPGWNSGNSALPNHFHLRGAGLSMVWAPSGRWAVRAVLASPVGINPGREAATGRNADGRPSAVRGWMSATAQF